ncbi:hypothetical protein I302_104507 [Kwoniella bestiolae CBS 10118]|uniref:Uncharacterized protein n=1 Tax=Kwoniella bestiolae CBS 10118 TaxID=1296100 RepID=A0A1B9GBG4_9TREE|nr:hypothetical protein I302_03213 [Kwoniella bestiolae CBS 10118]OCF28354.1 hypothetical protein I302_03213 [Kwoniella bestiolae CBS 10118]
MLSSTFAVTLLVVTLSCVASAPGLQSAENRRGIAGPAETIDPHNQLGPGQGEHTTSLYCATSSHPEISSTPVLLDKAWVVLAKVPTITTAPEVINTGMAAADYEWMAKREIEVRKKKKVKLPKTSGASNSTSTRSSAHTAIYHENSMSYFLIGIAALLGLTLAL